MKLTQGALISILSEFTVANYLKMKKRYLSLDCVKFLVIVFLPIFNACTHTALPKTEIWESKYHNFKAIYNTDWKLTPNMDTDKTTIFGIIDEKDGASYIVKIAKDVSRDQLADTNYYRVVSENMLKTNANNKLLKESEAMFHGKMAHKFIFLLYTEKYGMLKQILYIKRTGKEMYSVQISFPVNENNYLEQKIPQKLINIDKNVVIKVK